MQGSQERDPMVTETGRETLCSCDVCGGKQIKTLDAGCCISACAACGYVFDNPRPTAQEIAAFYSKPMKYNHWLVEERARDRLWKRRLKKMNKTRKPGSLLDVGTGVGQFLHHARPFYSEVFGTEVSETAIRIAKEKYALTVAKGVLGSVQLPEASFDNITLFHVLEHVPSPKSLIQRCRALLTDGGILVIAVPNDLGSLLSKVKVLLKTLGVRKYSRLGRLGLSRITLDGAMDEIHLSHFTPDVLRRLLEASGFSIVESALDRQYAARGLAEVIWGLYYAVCDVVRTTLKINVYETIWVVARKDPLT
jgi:SAM-dependent methyltransferase